MEVSVEAIVSIVGLIIAIPSAVFAIWNWRQHRALDPSLGPYRCPCKDTFHARPAMLPVRRYSRLRLAESIAQSTTFNRFDVEAVDMYSGLVGHCRCESTAVA